MNNGSIPEKSMINCKCEPTLAVDNLESLGSLPRTISCWQCESKLQFAILEGLSVLLDLVHPLAEFS